MSNLIRDALGAVIPQHVNEDGSYQVVSNGDTSGVDFSKTKLLRDAFGDPIPQLWDAASEQWIVLTSDGSIVTDIDFRKIVMLRDAFGDPIPQLWDVLNYRWIAQTEIRLGGGSGETPGGGSGIVEKPYPDIKTLTKGKDYICYSGKDEFYLIVFDVLIDEDTRVKLDIPSINEYSYRLMSNKTHDYSLYIFDAGNAWKTYNRYTDNLRIHVIDIRESSIDLYDSFGVNVMYAADKETPPTDGGSGGDVHVWDKPYPDHRELTNGKKYMIFENEQGFRLLIFGEDTNGRTFYTNTVAGSAGLGALKSTSSIRYEVYHINQGSWIKSNSYNDELDYALTIFFESTEDIYYNDKTTIFFTKQVFGQPPTGGGSSSSNDKLKLITQADYYELTNDEKNADILYLIVG